MSDGMQLTPIRVKGGTKGSSLLPATIEIQANSVFQVTETFEEQPSDWIQSDSIFMVSYVESLGVGEPDNWEQFCQTSTMAHPLTYAFKDADNNNIFTIQEIADGDNFYLQIAVAPPDDYFQISQQPKSGDNWTASLYNTTLTAVYAIDVSDRNDVFVCRLLRPNEEDIYLNIQ